ncbi:SGNH/GDSL hydrolase family protein [soil metagenome]
MSHRSRRTVAGFSILAPALALALVLAGCSGGDEGSDIAGAGDSTTSASPTVAPPGPDDIQYVALGDSYAAAPGVPETDQTGGCLRSDSNYAHVLAEADDLYLTDVTCSGATSQDVIDKQVPSLSKDTDVVTIGIGGNDFGLFGTLVRSCLSVGGEDAVGSPCTDALTDQIAQSGPKIQDNIGAALDAITAAAPQAEVYVVGYPRLLPETGTCPDLVPFAEGDYPLITTIVQALSAALKAEAEARDLTYVDAYGASDGHDICSDDPWVNGLNVAPDGTVPFHPFAEEQAAVAALIEDMQ